MRLLYNILLLATILIAGLVVFHSHNPIILSDNVDYNRLYENQSEKNLVTKDILQNNNIITIYGRSFNLDSNNKSGVISTFGKLGSLGFYKDFNDFWDGKLINDVELHGEKILGLKQMMYQLDMLNGKKGVIGGIHIVVYSPYYEVSNNTLKWFDNHIDYSFKKYLGPGNNLENNVIKPALNHGLVVFLDHQLGNKTVELSMEEIINKGYLLYPNVHLAFDPEWHAFPIKNLSHGDPNIGKIDSQDISNALAVLSAYIAENNIDRDIIVIIHDFYPGYNTHHESMVIDKQKIINPDPNHIKLVFDADGLGDQCLKLIKYKQVISNLTFENYRAIKFFPTYNPYTNKSDTYPILSMEQLIGLEDISVPCISGSRLSPSPDILIRN